MLLTKMIGIAERAHHQRYIQRPTVIGLEQFPDFLINLAATQPHVVDPFWGNN